MARKSCKTWSQRVFVQCPRREIAYIRFIIEAYDNLAYLTVADKYQAVLRIVFAPGQRPALFEVLAGLRDENVLEILTL